MTEEFNPPSIDPAQRDSIMGTIQFIIDKMVMQEIDKMMPCRVVAVQGNRVSVQILVNMVSTAGKQVKRAQIPNIPIYQPSAGGYVINLPVQAGDKGWIKATDTDISLFLQNLKQCPPNTQLIHKFDSSVFWPDNMGAGVSVVDASKLCLQTYDGTTSIVVGAGTVDITAPTSVTITSPTTTVTGNLFVDGNIAQANGSGATATFSGSIVAIGEVTGAGKVLGTHTHSGVQPGGGDTGPPV